MGRERVRTSPMILMIPESTIPRICWFIMGEKLQHEVAVERKHFKAINFDLDTNKLRLFYPRYQQAYKDLLIRFFKEHDFSHRQGSGYISNRKLSSADIVDLIGELRKRFRWSESCI